MDKLIVFQIAKPTQKGKKYKADVFWKDKRQWVHFGDDRHEQYKDQTDLKLWKHLDHGSKQRRELYHLRHRHNKGPAGLLSAMYLW